MDAKQVLKEELAQVDAKLDELRAKMKKVQEEITPVHNKREQLLNKIDELVIEESKEVNWPYLLECIPESKVKYKELNRVLEEKGMGTSGYYPDTNQRCVRISLHHTDKEKNQIQLQTLKEILPWIVPLVDKFGHRKPRKVIDIFEHTLSAGNSWKLNIYPNEIRVEDERYGGHSFQRTPSFKTLEEAFDYIAEKHWYEGGEEEDHAEETIDY